MNKERKPGWWYPYIFVAAFAVVVVVNGVLIFTATSTFSGLETENHYEKGLAYNKDIALARQQAALGWKVEAKIEPAADQPASGKLKVAVEAGFKDKDGRSIDNLTVRALFVRPTQAGHDVSVPMAAKGNGQYVTHTELDFHGLWDLHVVAIGEGRDSYQLTQRVQVP